MHQIGADPWYQNSGVCIFASLGFTHRLVWRSYRPEEFWGRGGRDVSRAIDRTTLSCLGQVKACLGFQTFPKKYVLLFPSNMCLSLSIHKLFITKNPFHYLSRMYLFIQRTFIHQAEVWLFKFSVN